MTDPYEVFGLPDDSDDEAIRRRYLELVRQYPPEHQPQRFAVRERCRAPHGLVDLRRTCCHRRGERADRQVAVDRAPARRGRSAGVRHVAPHDRGRHTC